MDSSASLDELIGAFLNAVRAVSSGQSSTPESANKNATQNSDREEEQAEVEDKEDEEETKEHTSNAASTMKIGIVTQTETQTEAEVLSKLHTLVGELEATNTELKSQVELKNKQISDLKIEIDTSRAVINELEKEVAVVNGECSSD